MTRARIPRPHEVAAARRDERLRDAVNEKHDNAWRTRGACQAVDPETFFPPPLAPADAAVALCARCPVTGACLAWALNVGDCHGVWGGTTARERRAMLVAWRTEEQPEEAAYAHGGGQETIVCNAELVRPRSWRIPQGARQLPGQIPSQVDRAADRALAALVETDLEDRLLLVRQVAPTSC